MACNGLKRGAFHLFVHPKWSRFIFGKKHIFDPLWSHFFVPKNNPFSRHFGVLGGSKGGHHEPTTPQKHWFWHSMWSRIIF